MDDLGALASTADVVAAFVAKNPLSASDLPKLILSVHKALSTLHEPEPEAVKGPAVPIRRSIQPDFLVCLEDGLRFKSLKRHLRVKFDLSPEAYRHKWGLPKTYPMVAPSYAEVRSKLARAAGLGSTGRTAAKGGKRRPKVKA